MIVLETIAVAFAMFSAIPVPQPEWNQRNMRYALCAFPLVGVVIGIAWWAWAAVCGVLEFPALLRAAGFCLLPMAITGGIHLDGYADTSDALASCASPEVTDSVKILVLLSTEAETAGIALMSNSRITRSFSAPLVRI